MATNILSGTSIMSDATITVFTAHNELENITHQIAAQLQLPIAGPDDLKSQKFQFALIVEKNIHNYQIELHQLSENTNPVVINFESDALNYRINFGGGRKQAIGRAVGIKPGKTLSILDCCAGLGKDALILAALGCKVTMLERNPVIGTLLKDGLRRFQQSKNNIATRLTLMCADSLQYLKQPENIKHFDVIYLDPMYPHRNKSALVKKEMRFLRDIVGDDADISQLLSIALHSPVKRIVLKRPTTASSIDTVLKPSHHIDSKNTRYEVYCKP